MVPSYLTSPLAIRGLMTLGALLALLTIGGFLTDGKIPDSAMPKKYVHQIFKSKPESLSIPRKIFQTWKKPATGLDGGYLAWSKTWTDMNPKHRYEIITDDAELPYVQQHYAHDQRIVSTFAKISDPILRADYLRYLILLSEGGVYTDMDTSCSKPIDQWVPEHLKDQIQLVVGLEFDALGMNISGRADFAYIIQFSQWTIMSAPNHPFVRSVVEDVTHNLEALGEGKSEIKAETDNDVLKTTGPKVFTLTMMAELSKQTGQTVTFADLYNMTEPQQFGSILVLAINGFAAGSGHSGAADDGKSDQQLIKHNFMGWQTWRAEHTIAEAE